MSTKHSHRRRKQIRADVSWAFLIIPGIVLGLLVTVLLSGWALFR